MRKISAFTLIEIMISIIIIGILCSLAVVGYSKQIKVAAENKAKLNLKLVWSDEQDYYNYRGRYVDEWDLLSIPQPADENYEYEITKATYDELEIMATPKVIGKGFLINEEGEISEF